MTEDLDHVPDMDALSRTCPQCGASADWPDCEACGFAFDPTPMPAAIDLDAAAAELVKPPEPELLQAVPLADLMTTTPPAVRFVVDPIIPRNVVTLLSAHGGSGKSILALAIAAHVAAGRPWAGFPVIQGRAVFVSLEDPGDVVRYRLRKIVEACGLDADAVLSGLAILDGTDLSAGLIFETWSDGARVLLESPAMTGLRDAAKDAALIVVDNASDAADFDENVRRFVRRFVRSLAKLARDNGAGLLLLAHIDKTAARYGAAGESYSGSTAWHNSVRSRLALLAKDGGTVEMAHEKANLSAKAEPRLFAWTDGGVLVATTAQAAQAGEQAASALLANEDAGHVLEALLTAYRGGVAVSTARTGSHAARVTLAACGLPDHLTSGHAARFYRALDVLLKDGRAVIEEVTTSDRKTRERILPAPVLRASNSAPPVPPHPHSEDWRTRYAPVAPILRQSEPAQLAQTPPPRPKWADPDPKEAA